MRAAPGTHTPCLLGVQGVRTSSLYSRGRVPRGTHGTYGTDGSHGPMGPMGPMSWHLGRISLTSLLVQKDHLPAWEEAAIMGYAHPMTLVRVKGLPKGGV